MQHTHTHTYTHILKPWKLNGRGVKMLRAQQNAHKSVCCMYKQYFVEIRWERKIHTRAHANRVSSANHNPPYLCTTFHMSLYAKHIIIEMILNLAIWFLSSFFFLHCTMNQRIRREKKSETVHVVVLCYVIPKHQLGNWLGWVQHYSNVCDADKQTIKIGNKYNNIIS